MIATLAPYRMGETSLYHLRFYVGISRNIGRRREETKHFSLAQVDVHVAKKKNITIAAVDNRTMGSKSSKPTPTPTPMKSLRDRVEEEIGRRMMIQREVQMAINIAKARDTLQIFGSAWATFSGGVMMAKLAGKNVPPAAGVPIVIGGLVLGNIADMAYGNKLARVSKEAEHIIENERARLVPMKQAPVSRFYTMEEKAEMFDQATAAGLLWPSNMVSRSVSPK